MLISQNNIANRVNFNIKNLDVRNILLERERERERQSLRLQINRAHLGAQNDRVLAPIMNSTEFPV
jgi:hypothetical protein